METDKLNQSQIQNEVYINGYTGNPFVDAGIAAVCALTEKRDPTQISKFDLTQTAQQLIDFYLDGNQPKWQNLGKLFTICSIQQNPSNKKNRHKKYEAYLCELIEKTTPANSSGNCIGCGKRDTQPLLHGNSQRYPYRDEYPLSGSGGVLNYYSFFEQGMPLCPLCTLLLQYVPLYVISNGKRLFLVHSHNPVIMQHLARNAVTSIKGKSSMGTTLTFYKPSFNFFNINECAINVARDVLNEASAYEERSGQTAIRIYSFVNSGQLNRFDFGDLPSEVFEFLEDAYRGDMKANITELFRESKGFTKKGRDIYSCLVNEFNISVPFFIRPKEKRVVGGWQLLELYLTRVRKMEKDKIEIVKKVGKRLYYYLKPDFRKLRDLETDDFKEFKAALERFQKLALIYEIDDVPLLFPKDEKGCVRWRETQNLLLGYIYELMHKDKLEVKA
ncbi:MAG: type I-B CRISPR-associated protein Cas8b1/Cst1 [Candidatus Bathyarchaeota archaeon]|nr:type I-B CRISPR-associated protein Cas8b1/Cst1 [Candidatus Bathyarchaeota archaeon]